MPEAVALHSQLANSDKPNTFDRLEWFVQPFNPRSADALLAASEKNSPPKFLIGSDVVRDAPPPAVGSAVINQACVAYPISNAGHSVGPGRP